MRVPYRVLVTGSRNWTNRATIKEAMIGVWETAMRPEEMVLVSGANPKGADHIAEQVASDCGWRIERHPAQWDKWGKAAGVRRNTEMVESGVDVCIAFIKDRSKGATNCSQTAMRAGIETRVWRETTTSNLFPPEEAS